MADVEKKIIIDIETNAQQATQKMDGLKGAVSGVDKATGGLLSSLKKLITNPYIAIIGALAAVFMKLKNAISQSDDAGTAFARVLNILKAPLQIINKLFDSLANSLGRVADAFADTLKNIMPEKWREQAEAEDELVVATDRLEEAEREYALNHAEREAERARLNNIARDSENRTFAERRDAAQRALQFEIEDVREARKNINEKIRLFELERRNQKSWSDDEKKTYDDLIVARKNLNVQFESAVRESQRTMRSISDEQVDDWAKMALSAKDYRSEINKTVESQYVLLRTRLQYDMADAATNVHNALQKVIDDRKTLARNEEKSVENAQKMGKGYEGYIQSHSQSAAAYREDVVLFTRLQDAIKKGDEEQTYSLLEQVKATNLLGDTYANVRDEAIATVRTQRELSDLEIEQQNTVARLIGEVQTKVKASAKDINNEILNTQHETLSIQLDTQEEWLKNQKGLSAEVNKENVRFAKESLALNNQIEDLQKKQAAATSKELKDVYQEQIDALIAKGNELANTYQSNISKILKENADKRREESLDDLQLQIDIAAEEEQLLIEKAQKEKEINEQRRQEAQETARQIAQSSTDILSSFASVAGSIADHYHQKYEEIVNGKDELSQEEAERAIAALEREKEATKAQLILQQAVAIGNAIVAATSAAAQSGIAAPVVYAATAATITAGLISSFIAANDAMKGIDEQIAAVKAKATGYATGGYIEGAGTATSDSIPARLSNGESVINARSTARFYDLLSAINQAGGGVAFPNAMSVPQLNFANGGVAQSYENTYKMIESAVAGIQPVVSVKEITKVQNRLKAKEII